VFWNQKPIDLDAARDRMVTQQLESRDISDQRVLQAMRHVPRHLFVPEDRQSEAYQDRPLSIGYGQTISQPYIVGYMTAALALSGDEKVLEIGTGSGYQAAVLSRVASQVITVEYIPELADTARTALANLGYDNVEVLVGDGSAGWLEEAPYEAIMFTAAAPEIPAPLRDQLADGGRLVGPVGSRYDQVLVRVWRIANEWKTETLKAVIFVPLVGEHGWRNY
jgi:protein-L-isoaspartate(D-aspartate) O-methyltransferase